MTTTTNKKRAVAKRRVSKYPWHFKYIFGALRRIWGWSPNKKAALKRAHRGMNIYECERCFLPSHRTEIHVDHIEPVVPISGFIDWNSHIARLFCPPVGLMVLCKSCHSAKTKTENAQRKEYRRQHNAQ